MPKHIFSTGPAAAHPDTWDDRTRSAPARTWWTPARANNIQYVANPDYWQPGKPYMEKIQYPAYLDNGPANLDLASGKAQWGSQFIPNIRAVLPVQVQGQPHLVAAGDQRGDLPEPRPVARRRRASSRCGRRSRSPLDRQKIATIGEGGQQPAANQTGIVVPTFQKYYDQAAVAAAGYDKPNPEKAKQLLAGLGYSPANPLKLTIITITGYTDWDASLAVVKQQLSPSAST